MVRHAIVVKHLESFCLPCNIETLVHPSASLPAHERPKRGVVEKTPQRCGERADVAFRTKQASLSMPDDLRNGAMGETDNRRANCLRFREDHPESFHLPGRRFNARITQDASPRHAICNFEGTLHAAKGRANREPRGKRF